MTEMVGETRPYESVHLDLSLGGRVYYIVGLWQRWLVKPAPEMACRGGFYQQYFRLTNNLQKPAPTQPITQINLMFDRIQKM